MEDCVALAFLVTIASETNALIREITSKRKRFRENMTIALQSYVKENKKRTKISNYVEDIVRFYSDIDFKAHFRLTRTTVETIIQLIESQRNKKIKNGRPAISTTKQVLLSIWVLSNQESFRGVADRFGVNKGHAHRIFMNYCDKMCNFVNMYMKWPEDDQIQKSIHNFEQLRRVSIPGVIVCVDGTHIEIKSPKEDSSSYYNRKGTHSILLQIICSAKMLIIDVFVGWPGSSNDARVWKQSPIYSCLKNEPNKYLTDDCHLLGDSAYPLDSFILTPYRDNGLLTTKERNFNKIHSSVRVIVEQTVGLLKGRFRRLKFLDMDVSGMSKVVMTCCILHNLCINKGEDNISDEILDSQNDDDNIVTCNNATAITKRNKIADILMKNISL